MIEKYLDNRFLVLFLIPFVIGSLTVFSFQPFNFSIINFFILPSFFYLIVHIKKKSKGTYKKRPFKKNLFIFGSAFGFGFFLSGIHWITNSLTFDESFKILIPFALILIPIFLSLFFSLVTVIVGPFLNLNFKSVLLFSSGLALADYIRAKILTGFPWNMWVYSISWSSEMLQILNKIGLFGLNLVVITIFMTPIIIFFNSNFNNKLVIFFFSLIFVALIYIYGNFKINQNLKNLENYKEKYNIKVVSPNFDLEYGLTKNEIKDRIQKLIKYSDPNNKKKTLFVWPEGAFGGLSFNEILIFKNLFLSNFNDNHYILFGTNRHDKNKDGFYNSMFLVNNKLEVVQEYKKQKLVPFGEFLPFEKLLKKFGLKKITEGHGSFLKGELQNNLVIDNLNILPLICYEIIFSDLVQSSNKETNLIINISEDGWFGKSIGPHQHFAKGLYRAIENDSFLIRSANKGISAIVNNKGQILKKLNANEAGNIEFEVPLIKSRNKNKNDLIFFALLITYIFIFRIYSKKNDK